MSSANRTVALAAAFAVAAWIVGTAATVVAQPATCWGVEVVDGRGRPVPGAEVTEWYGDPDSERGTGGQAWDTDERGWACSEDFVEGALIEINAPAELGGACAGNTRVAFRPPFTRVVMTLRPRRQGVLRGRVVSPDHRPVVGAVVWIEEVRWRGQECVVTPEERALSGADGSFSFPQLPRGSAMVRVEHDRFARREITARVPGTAPDVVMTAGASWRGRIVEPGGAVVTRVRARLRVNQPRGYVERFSPWSDGFAFEGLPGGEGTLLIDVDTPALGQRRIERHVVLAADVARREDLIWPAGGSISGKAVTPTGAPVPHARLFAYPKGAEQLGANRGYRDQIESRTDDAGSFTLRYLAPGTWVVGGSLPSGKAAAIEVPAGSDRVQLVIPSALIFRPER